MNILSIATSHDASVSLFCDGKLKYFGKEERLSGFKHDRGCTKALDYIIKNDLKVDLVILNAVFSPDHFNYFLEPVLRKQFDCDVIHYENEHHLSHAILAFQRSDFEESLVCVIDRNGSTNNYFSEVESILKIDKSLNVNTVYKNFAIPHVGKINFEKELLESKINSLLDRDGFDDNSFDRRYDSILGITQVYESATTLIGEHVLNNGKVMGLSSYGKDSEFKNLFYNGIADSHLFMRNTGTENKRIWLKEYYGKETKEITKSNYQFYADYAFQVQKQTQEEVLRIIKTYVEKTNIKKVCVSGGYGLNVVTNSYLVKNLPDVDFYFDSIPDDTGISLGAGSYYYKKKTGIVPTIPKDTFFHHVSYDLKGISGKRVSARDIARFIVEGKIVAVFNGQAETGPRALGNRSILFDARNPDAKEIINTVKGREWYRPFACSVLKEDAKEYFDMYHLDESPNMTLSFPVKTSNIPGVTHVDNTCRIQTVDRSIPHFYNVLKEFRNLTGVSVLLNTSFNLAGNPLVETPEEAIKVFKESKIDVLWFPEINRMISE